jgi:hypothetical protein
MSLFIVLPGAQGARYGLGNLPKSVGMAGLPPDGHVTQIAGKALLRTPLVRKDHCDGTKATDAPPATG